ncbi:MAG: FtsW/RodA/SpoVE family cell cycle protein [Bacteroidales bacterium]|nr:FtsW/RodA/SpoVE family cell cycle protein [Bacteroidales bacterium]
MDNWKEDIKKFFAAKGINSFGDLFIGNTVIWVIYVVLSVISIVAVYSSSGLIVLKNHSSLSIFIKQLSILFGGFITVILTSQLVFRYKPGVLKKLSPFFYVVAIIGLCMTFFSAFSAEINGANRWISIFGVTIQPSEFAKVALVLLIARIFDKNEENVTDKNKVLYPMLGCAGLMAGIILISNFSTALFIATITFVMMLLGGIPFRQISALIGVGLIGAAIMGGIILKKPDIFPRGKTWQTRLITYAPFLAEYTDSYVVGDGENTQSTKPTGDNYQITQSKIAIAKGFPFGKGPGGSEQRFKLSQAYCDFIYAIIIEETGWLGTIAILAIFFWLSVQALIIARKIQHTFDTLVVLGLSFVMTFQAFIHMMVVVELFPVTGQTLPVISAGGTSLLFISMQFGIILGMSKYAETKAAERKESEKKTKVEQTNN